MLGVVSVDRALSRGCRGVARRAPAYFHPRTAYPYRVQHLSRLPSARQCGMLEMSDCAATEISAGFRFSDVLIEPYEQRNSSTR